jgi:cytochrome c peroxidase
VKPKPLALIVSASLFGVSLVEAQSHREPSSRTPILPLPAQATAEAPDPAKVALGRDLFFDQRLSRSMTLSCDSCHDITTNGASSVSTDRDDSGRMMHFNTPTVFNSVYSFRLGWQGKLRSLHDFALGSVRSERLMNGGGLTARRLAADRVMVDRFQRIYQKPPNDDNVADALSVFMETLVTPDAPFDRWLRRDKTALTTQQLRGYARFQKLGCSSCHQGVNIGANILQRRGIFHPLGDAKPKFLRVPSLRNVAVTSPYFHDGSVASLPDAIRQMAHSQLDLTISDRDTADITAFLRSLTGTYDGHSLRAKARPLR